MNNKQSIAAGIHIEPLLNGNVRIEFFDEADQPIRAQIVTRDVLDSLPFVVALTQFGMSKGKMSCEFVKELNKLIGTTNDR